MVLFFISFASGSDWAWGQTSNSFCGTISKTALQPWQMQDELYYDRFGNTYAKSELIKRASSQANNCTGDGFFDLTFEADEGASWTSEEQETICAVFSYLSTLMASTTVNVPIKVTKTNSLATGVLATGSPIFNGDNCGIANTTLYEVLRGSTTFPASFFHGLMNVKQFTPGGNTWHTLNQDTNPTTPGLTANQYDLYTVALHEALHILGFASRISQTGAPSAGGGTLTYSRWDTYLYQKAAAGATLTSLILPNPSSILCCNPYAFNDAAFTPMPTSLMGDCSTSRLAFSVDGTSVLAPVNKTDSPADDMQNRLSHLQMDCKSSVGVINTEEYVMHPTIGTQTTRRVVTPTEITILCQLGYTMAAAPTTCLNNCGLVVNDDTAPTIIVSVSPSIPVQTATLTANDIIPATGTTIGYLPDCGSLLTFTGQQGLTVSLNGSTFTLMGILPGNYTFCYSVTCTASGQCETGIVHVLVMATPIPLTCNDPTCNLVCYGDFEAFTPGGAAYTNQINATGAANDGFYYQPMPDDFYHSLTTDIHTYGTNTKFVRLVDGYTQTAKQYKEHLLMPLSHPVANGCTVTVTFDGSAQRVFESTTIDPTLAFFALTGNPLCPNVGSFINPVYVAYNYPGLFIDCPQTATSIPLCNVNAYPMTANLNINCGITIPLQYELPIQDPSNPNPGTFNSYTFTWTNNTGVPVTHLMAIPTLAMDYTDARAVFIDNMVVTSSCAPIVTITPTQEYNCISNTAYLDYEVCLNASSPASPVALNLQAQITDPTVNVSFGSGGSFDLTGNATTTVTADNCVHLQLNLNIPCTTPLNHIIPVNLQLIQATPTPGTIPCVQVNTPSFDFVFAGCSTVSITGDDNICQGQSATLTATGGGTYEWSTLETTAAISVTTAGTYTVTVTDTNGCTATTASTTVTVNALPTASISGAISFCAGNSTALTATGGGTYAWSNGAIATSISIITAGTYTVTVTNAAGCTNTATKTVTVDASPIASISAPTSLCAGSSATLTASGGSSYVWSNGSAGSSVNVSSAGTYTVTVTGINGCSTTTAATVSITPQEICCIANTTYLTFNGGTLNYTAPAVTATVTPTSPNNPFGAGVGTAANPVRINGDITIPAGATITFDGMNFEFGINGRIKVATNGRLIITGSTLRGNPLCQTMWQGIRVQGPGENLKRLTTGGIRNYGIVELTGIVNIEDAIIGAAGMYTPLIPPNALLSQVNQAQDLNTLSTLIMPAYTSNNTAHQTAGGVVRVNGHVINFTNCFQGVNLSWYRYNGGIDAPSWVHQGNFAATRTLWYPFSQLPTAAGTITEVGVVLNYYNSIRHRLKPFYQYPIWHTSIWGLPSNIWQKQHF
jgi:hypothetical protein